MHFISLDSRIAFGQYKKTDLYENKKETLNYSRLIKISF